ISTASPGVNIVPTPAWPAASVQATVGPLSPGGCLPPLTSAAALALRPSASGARTWVNFVNDTNNPVELLAVGADGTPNVARRIGAGRQRWRPGADQRSGRVGAPARHRPAAA